MFSSKFYLLLIILHSIRAQPQLNLYYTTWINENNEHLFFHDCIRIVFLNANKNFKPNIESESTFYCLNNFPSQRQLIIDKNLVNFTFVQLQQRNITIEQLYSWSAPIDLMEDYQIYLNTNDTALANKQFYNCTLPRFGSQCEYELGDYSLEYSSFYTLMTGFYSALQHTLPTLTCYEHLKCDHDAILSCLQWTDICDGIVNCLNDGIDERDCWQLEINQCNDDDEHRCQFGQCIPKSFYRDTSIIADCIDAANNGDQVGMPYNCGLKYISVLRCNDRIPIHKDILDRYISYHRNKLLNMKHLHNTDLYSDNCWFAFICLINIEQRTNSFCLKFCQLNRCQNLIETSCSDLIFYYNSSVLFGNIYLAYHKKHLYDWTNVSLEHVYMCYNTIIYHQIFMNISKIAFNNLTCVHIPEIIPNHDYSRYTRQNLHLAILDQLHNQLKKYHPIFNYTTEHCNRSTMYQCRNSSKCISIYRLMNFVYDCPLMDDEDITLIHTSEVLKLLDKNHFKCRNSNRYIPPDNVKNYICDCLQVAHVFKCEDENLDIIEVPQTILFQHICDGFIDLLSPNMFDSENSTDETECQYWECNNIYTQCDREWNCPTAEDEFGCIRFTLFNCSLNERFCISYDTNERTCISSEKINDGHMDCLGGVDESLCQRNIPLPSNSKIHENFRYFYCSNQTSHLCISQDALCDGQHQCEHGDDEKACGTHKYIFYPLSREYIQRKHFKLSNYETFREPISTKNTMILHTLSQQTTSNINRYSCGFGLPIRLLSIPKNASQTSICLCPPNFYGHLCQYQNQRISLVVKFQALSDSARTLFAIVIQLIDNTTEKIVHSVEQVNFLSLTDCRTKFNMYLLYSTRPKHSDREYAIHIDFYERDLLKYRGSVLYPVQFSFLPVHRLAYLIQIPSNNDKLCFNRQCQHGQCMKYWNNLQNYTFCQCEHGWSGKFCQIPQHCQCSSDSICLGKLSNNRSICICPKNKFGSRCYLNNSFQSTCANGSESISDDNSLISNQKFKCHCPNGLSGDQCEIIDNKIIIHFENNLIQSEKHVFIHFYEVLTRGDSTIGMSRSTTFRTISMETHSLLIQWSQKFHLVFLELSKKTYYLVHILYTSAAEPIIINKTINSSDRCPNTNELFNQTIRQWKLIRQIKYYHLFCLNRSLNLKCFHDEVHLCLCYEFQGKRLANCFQFDHNLTYNCFGQSECENGGQCLQDHPTCPTRSICLCKPCFYGRRCQYRTSGSILSLDPILGYYILPTKNFIQQPIIIKISLALTIIFMIAGLINGIFSLMTFKNKTVQEVGCGLYLLGSSITTIILMILLVLKFVFLLLTQMTILTNMSFLQIQCYSLDFLIRVCLSLDQWFNASVAFERALTTIQGPKFNKKKSLIMTKRIICFLIIIIILTSIHDPLSRYVIIEDNENEDQYQIKRIWCIVRYSSFLEFYNSFIHTFHFLGPFLFNFISSIILIVKKSRQQQNLHPDQSYKTIIRKQFQDHKHILIAPIVLVLLALPRLILTYIRTCMQSENDAWLYLCGHFVSFIPPMLTFVIFILPSKFYKKQFRQTVNQYRKGIKRLIKI